MVLMDLSCPLFVQVLLNINNYVLDNAGHGWYSSNDRDIKPLDDNSNGDTWGTLFTDEEMVSCNC